MTALLRKQCLLMFIFFGVLAVSVLSPIASNQYMPTGPDFANHTTSIVQAKQALDAGQFPVRTAPGMYYGWGYAQFQFYSPLAYTVTGEIYKYLIPDNPFLALKVMLWFMLTLSGVYMFYLTRLFVRSNAAAFLGAVAYMMAPYLLTNINARGDFTESLAMCLIPIALFYSIQQQRSPDIRTFLGTALAWFALATTHITTFVFTSLFAGLFMVIVNIQEQIPLRRLFMLGIAYGFAWLLALWYLAPAISLQPYLYAHHLLSNPYYFNWLNPLATMLSPSAVSPMPLPGNGKLYAPFYAAIGWPILIGVGIAIYKIMLAPKLRNAYFVAPLLFLFFLALFLAWSPVNFWIYLPPVFKMVQFGCRFLIQVSWIGVILFAWALTEIFEHKLDTRHVVLGVLLIGMACGSWLATGVSSNRSIADLIAHPTLRDWGANAYVVSPLLYPHAVYSNNMLSVEDTLDQCHQNKLKTECTITVDDKNQLVQLPIIFYPKMLDIRIDGHFVSYEATPLNAENKGALDINPMMVSLDLKRGTYHITEHYVGLKWANVLSRIAWIFVLLMVVFDVLIVILRNLIPEESLAAEGAQS